MFDQNTSVSLNLKVGSMVLLAFPLCVGRLSAEDSQLKTNSPFLPPGYKDSKVVVAPPIVQQTNGAISREIEFRGVVQFNGVYEFSLFNKTEQRGYWIAENQSDGGISVSSFAPDSMAVTVTLNGRSESLSLMSATDSPLPVPASQSTPAKTPSVRPNIPGLNTSKTASDTRRTVIPRRRVILPKK